MMTNELENILADVCINLYEVLIGDVRISSFMIEPDFEHGGLYFDTVPYLSYEEYMGVIEKLNIKENEKSELNFAQ